MSTIIFTSASAITAANLQSRCGFSDWVINEPKDITTIPNCNDMPTDIIYDYPTTTSFDIGEYGNGLMGVNYSRVISPGILNNNK